MLRIILTVVLIIVIYLLAAGVSHLLGVTPDQALLYLIAGIVIGIWTDSLVD